MLILPFILSPELSPITTHLIVDILLLGRPLQKSFKRLHRFKSDRDCSSHKYALIDWSDF